MTCMIFFQNYNLHLIWHILNQIIFLHQDRICVMGFTSVYFYILPINIITNMGYDDSFLNIWWDNRAQVLSPFCPFTLYEHCFRSLITIGNSVFVKVVIHNKIWLNPGWEPETNDCIFWTILLTLVAYRSESCTKPFLPIAALGLTIHAIKLNNRLPNSKSSPDSKIFWGVGGQGIFSWLSISDDIE